MPLKPFLSAVRVGRSYANKQIYSGRAKELDNTLSEANRKTPQTADEAMHILLCHLDLASNCESWKTEKKNSRAITVTSP